jgi:hypothetical protein
MGVAVGIGIGVAVGSGIGVAAGAQAANTRLRTIREPRREANFFIFNSFIKYLDFVYVLYIIQINSDLSRFF